MAESAVTAITKIYGTPFTYGDICSIIYPSAGCNVDYFYEDPEIAIPFATTVELRDDGNYGFLVPERYIREVATEMYGGYVEQMAYIMEVEVPGLGLERCDRRK